MQEHKNTRLERIHDEMMLKGTTPGREPEIGIGLDFVLDEILCILYSESLVCKKARETSLMEINLNP